MEAATTTTMTTRPTMEPPTAPFTSAAPTSQAPTAQAPPNPGEPQTMAAAAAGATTREGGTQLWAEYFDDNTQHDGRTFLSNRSRPVRSKGPKFLRAVIGSSNLPKVKNIIVKK